MLPACPLEPELFPAEELGAEPDPPTVTVTKWSIVLVLTRVTTDVMTEGAAVGQVEVDESVREAPAEVEFGTISSVARILAEDAEGVKTVTVEVRLRNLVTVARFAEVTVVGVTIVVSTLADWARIARRLADAETLAKARTKGL